MTCRELVAFLAEYLSGELPSRQRRIFEEHLESCPDCVRYVEGYRATVAAGKAAFGEPDRDLPEDVPQKLVDAVLAARRRSGGSA